jgi:hypothetical protein
MHLPRRTHRLVTRAQTAHSKTARKTLKTCLAGKNGESKPEALNQINVFSTKAIPLCKQSQMTVLPVVTIIL